MDVLIINKKHYVSHLSNVFCKGGESYRFWIYYLHLLFGILPFLDLKQTELSIWHRSFET